MANFYIYLISSLPSLSFGAKPPFSFENFLKACEGLIPGEDMNVIRSVGESVFDLAPAKNLTLKKWIVFDTILRNELVKIRSSRKKIDPAKYLREDGHPESASTAHIAISACRKPSLLDAEKALDLDRWNYLEELSMGHYFDLDILIIYAIKLLLLEKWYKVQSADANKILEEVLN